jgi:hypothetical protein
VNRCLIVSKIHRYRDSDIDDLKSKIDEIHKCIIGNGKPGLNSDMRLVMNNIQVHNERLGKVERVADNLDKKLAYYAGGIAIIVFLITLFVPKIIGG